MSDDLIEQFGSAVHTRVDRELNRILHRSIPEPAPQAAEPSSAQQTGGTSRWSAHEGKFWGASQTATSLPPGLYRCGMSPTVGPILESQRNDTDALLRLPDSHAEDVLREITEFSALKPAFVQRGFLFKRGVLLVGPPGSGKTCVLRLLVEMVIKMLNGIAVVIDHPVTAAQCLCLVRKIEPTRQIVGIMEDLDALTERHGESEYLALLDGESQVDDIIMIATTNYPDRLDRRFVDRPSRFDTIRYVGMPSPAARRAYLKAKEPGLGGDELERYVRVSDGYSIAHLRELVILTQCFRHPLEKAAERLHAMRQRKESGSRAPDAPTFGFANGG